MSTVYERVRQAIMERSVLSEDRILPNSSLVDDLGADSLDLVELAERIEEEFSVPGGRTIQISDEDAERITTDQDIVNYLKDQGIEDE